MIKLWKPLSLLLIVTLISLTSYDNAYAAAQKLSLNITNKTVYTGSSFTLRVMGTTKKATWSSSNTKIIKVKNGTVTALSKGTAKITARVNNHMYSCSVTVKEPYLNAVSLKLKVKEKFKLKLTGASVSSWSTSNKAVASIDKNGNILALKAGTAIMTVNKKYKCNVVVRASAPTPIPTPTPLLVDKLKTLGDSKQVILVTSNQLKTVSCKVDCYEKVNNKWKQVFSTMPGVIGKKGFSMNRTEGDNTTPVGKFSLGTAFGKYKNPGTKMPYRVTTKNDVWSNDPKYYNMWVTDPKIQGEFMLRKDSLYDYGFVINYNIPERIVGKGSGIFFHIWRSSDLGTAGCVATSETDLLKVLKWLDPSEKPLIIEGPTSEVLKY